MIQTDAWLQILDELQVRSSRHLLENESQVNSFMQKTEARYASEVEAFLDLYRRDSSLSPILAPLLLEVRGYLLWLCWIGWNISNLGPVLYPDTLAANERLALGMLAYVSGRLIDDGLDNHESYKGRRKSLVGVLRGQLPDAPLYAACVQSVYVGFSLFHHALRRMRQCSHLKCAEDVSRMFDVTSVGVFAEWFVKPQLNEQTYRQIIRRKSVAYNMILYKTFLAEDETDVRAKLLTILASMDELAQIINDFRDVQEDQSLGLMNALTHGVYDSASIHSVIFGRMQQLQELSSSLPPKIQDALAAMFKNVVAPYLQKLLKVDR